MDSKHFLVHSKYLDYFLNDIREQNSASPRISIDKIWHELLDKKSRVLPSLVYARLFDEIAFYLGLVNNMDIASINSHIDKLMNFLHFCDKSKFAFYLEKVVVIVDILLEKAASIGKIYSIPNNWNAFSYSLPNMTHPYISISISYPRTLGYIVENSKIRDYHEGFYKFLALMDPQKFNLRIFNQPFMTLLQRIKSIREPCLNLISLSSQIVPNATNAIERHYFWSYLIATNGTSEQCVLGILSDCYFLSDIGNKYLLKLLHDGSNFAEIKCNYSQFAIFLLISHLFYLDETHYDIESTQLTLSLIDSAISEFYQNSLFKLYIGVLWIPILKLLSIYKSNELITKALSRLLLKLREIISQEAKETPFIQENTKSSLIADYFVTSALEFNEYGFGNTSEISWLIQSVELIDSGSNINMACLDRLICHNYAKDKMFELLPLIFYLLESAPDASSIIHLVTVSVPKMIQNTSRDDEFLLKIKQFYVYLTQNCRGPLLMISIKGIFECWLVNKSFWALLFDKCTKIIDQSTNEETITSCMSVLKDVCKLRPLDHGHQILPIANQVLKRKKIHQSTLFTILEIINICIEANMVDPKSVWDLILRSRFGKLSVINHNCHITCQLVRYFGLVAKMADFTETYDEFRKMILFDYLLPLFKPSNFESSLVKEADNNDEMIIEDAAISALSNYQMDEICEIFKNRDFSVDKTIYRHSSLILSLIRQEIKSMRRSVFLGTGVATKASTKSDPQNPFLRYTRRVLMDVQLNLLNYWEDSKNIIVSPSLRSAYAMSSLLMSKGILSCSLGRSVSISDSNLEWLFIKIRDYSLSDLEFNRDSRDYNEITIAWISFWKCFIPGLLKRRVQTWIEAEKEFSGKATQHLEFIKECRDKVLNDIIDESFGLKLKNRENVNVINLVLCATGFSISLQHLSIPNSSSIACRISKLLATLSFSDESHVTIPGDLHEALYHSFHLLTPLVAITDEDLAIEIFDRIYGSTESTYLTDGVIYRAFFCFGACPTWLSDVKTSEEIANGNHPIMEKYFTIIELINSHLSEGNFNFSGNDLQQISGFLSGMSTIDGQNSRKEWKMSEIYTKCSNMLCYISNDGFKISEINFDIVETLLPAMAHCAANFTDDILKDLNTLKRLHAKLKLEFRGMRALYRPIHEIDKACIRLNYKLLRINSVKFFDEFNEIVERLIAEFGSKDTSASQKESIMSVFGTLAGFERFKNWNIINPVLKDLTMDSSDLQNIIYPVIRRIAELSQIDTRGSFPAKDLKVAGVGMIVLNKWLIGWFPSAGFVQPKLSHSSDINSQKLAEDLEKMLIGEEEGSGETLMMSTEPHDFSRLSNDSILKKLHQKMSEATTYGQKESLIACLNLFIDLDCYLPVVNWNETVLEQVSGISSCNSIQNLTLKFASKFCLQSKSLTLYLLRTIEKLLEPDKVSKHGYDEEFFQLTIEHILPVITEMVVHGHIQISKWSFIIQKFVDFIFFCESEANKMSLICEFCKFLWKVFVSGFKLLESKTKTLNNPSLLRNSFLVLTQRIMPNLKFPEKVKDLHKTYLDNINLSIFYSASVINLYDPNFFRLMNIEQPLLSLDEQERIQVVEYSNFCGTLFLMSLDSSKSSHFTTLLNNHVLLPKMVNAINETEAFKRVGVWMESLCRNRLKKTNIESVETLIVSITDIYIFMLSSTDKSHQEDDFLEFAFMNFNSILNHLALVLDTNSDIEGFLNSCWNWSYEPAKLCMDLWMFNLLQKFDIYDHVPEVLIERFIKLHFLINQNLQFIHSEDLMTILAKFCRILRTFIGKYINMAENNIQPSTELQWVSLFA